MTVLGNQETVRMDMSPCHCRILKPQSSAIRDYLSGSKPRMDSYKTVWWSSCSRFEHYAATWWDACGVSEEFDHRGFAGGSLCISSGHSSSITARISSEMAETFAISRMYLCSSRRSAGVMTLPPATRGE